MNFARKKIAVILGTRTEAIKLAPVIQELQNASRYVTLCLITTVTQHEMLDDVLSAFSLQPDYDLKVMSMRQSLSLLAQNILEKLDYVLAMENPDLVIVLGNSAATFDASLAAFHRKIPVAHVESGVRSYEKMKRFPEETYKRLISQIADLHFTTTPLASRALRKEGIAKSGIVCTGSTVIDALHRTVRPGYEFISHHVSDVVLQKKRIVLVAISRLKNLREPIMIICSALKELSVRHKNVNFVFPVHVHPTVRDTVLGMLNEIPNIVLMEPLKYPDFVNLIASSYAVITDSGGLQEEATALGKPVLLLRDVTEHSETAENGRVKLVGMDVKNIVIAAHTLLRDKKMFRGLSKAFNLYGDGKASERIGHSLLRYFGFAKKKAEEFSPNGK